MNKILIAVLIIVVVMLLVVISIYNKLVMLRNRYKNAFAQIDVQLKRRYDLIPNLVSTVKGYAAQESSVLENVTKARNMAMNATSMGERLKDENALSGTLKSLFAVAEAYPDLKANQNFKQLQDELSDTETKVAAARQFYNTNVLDYNTAIQTVPTSIFANAFGFAPEEFFKATEQEKADIQVKF